MPDILYSSLPPTLPSISDMEMSILRNVLPESTVQILLNYARSKRPDERTDVYYLQDFMTDAQNRALESGRTINATDALQEIFDTVSGVYGVSAATNAVVKIPTARSFYQIEETCSYLGSTGAALYFQGEGAGLNRSGSTGPGLVWVGAEGGTMFDFRAINGSYFSDLAFSGGNKAKYLVRAREYFEDGNLIGSSGLTLERCRFSDPTRLDNTSCLFAAGSDNGVSTYQASEYNFLYCDFNGCNELGEQGWGFKALANGNTKNFFFLYNIFVQLHRGIEAGSGDLTCIACNGGEIGGDGQSESRLIYHYGNALTAYGGRFENNYAARYIVTGQGTTLQSKNFYVACKAPADDYVFIVGGPSDISGSFENNSRVGSNTLKIQALYAESSSGLGGVDITHSVFGHNGTALTSVPLYDGSSNLLTAGDYARNVGHKVFCHGNSAGPADSDKNTQLPDVSGDDIINLREQMKADDVPAGVTTVRNANGDYVVTVPYTVFQTASAGEIIIGQMPLKSKVFECLADTTAAFSGTGLSGTIQLRVGTNPGVYDDDSLLLAHDVKTGTTFKGQADADRGVGLATATAPHGYYGNWTGTGDFIKCKLIASAGLLANLTSGSVTFYITHRRVG